MVSAPDALELPVRRAKLRAPRLNSGLVSRPQLLARLEQGLCVSLMLVAAPAGFGKTTLLAEWAETNPTPLAWLSLDASDRTLKRFVTHVVAATETLVAGPGRAILNLLRQTDRPSPFDLGAALADELLDLPHDIVLILDDYQLAASADVEAFLAGLLLSPAPALHLVLATRSDPALPLARMRLRGQLSELRASDLRFSNEEAGQLLINAGHSATNPEIVAALQEQVGGWIAGLRLATLALPAIPDLAHVADVIAGEHHLMDFLVEEVLSAQPPFMQEFLLRTAVVDRICAPLADVLMVEPATMDGRETLERLARDSFFLEPTEDDRWFRYHPLFRSLLLHQLQARCSPAEIGTLHVRASDWYAAHGDLNVALRHRMAAGDSAGAAALAEACVLPALSREDWNAVAGWLALLPEPVVHRSPRLLLAKAWVSHFSGRSVPIRAMMAELESLLQEVADDETRLAFEAERAALSVAANVSSGRDRDSALEAARRAVDHVSPEHHLAAGLATFGLGCALHANGQTEEAIRFLTAAVEREEARVDAGSIRTLGGLMFVHRQAGNVQACASVSEHVLVLASRHELPVAAGWARWKLGWIAYWRDDLESASEHFSAIVADMHRVHLHCACEAFCGLALTEQARGNLAEATNATRALLEMILDGNALEYLPLLRGFEARLALLRGESARAIAWLEMEDGVTIESNGLDAFDHPYLTRIKALLEEGSQESLDRAGKAIEAFLAYTEERCHRAHHAEALALSALVLDAQRKRNEAMDAMQRSVGLAAPTGYIRTFLDLGSPAASLLSRLAERNPDAPLLRSLINAFHTRGAGHQRGASSEVGTTIHDVLTPREAEVLQGLARRLSYQEIASELFVSMETVKSHAARIYGKLGVSGRREALVKARSLGWVSTT